MVSSVRVVQVTSKTCLVSFRTWVESGLVGKIKKYGGEWNSAMGGYEVPLTHLSGFMREIRNQGIQIDEMPIEGLHQFINSGKKPNRILLFDSTLFKRFAFLDSFVSAPSPKKSFKNILLCCFESARDQWISRSIDSSSLNQFGSPAHPMCHSLCILTFQKLRDHGDILTRPILNEFTTIVVDDADIIFNTDHAIYNSLSEIPALLSETLRDKHAWDRDLILIVNKLQFSRPALILEVCSLLRPKEFGFDQLKIMCQEVNDATWMKRRYRKENKHVMKELMYVLKATVLVSLEGFEENRIVVNLGSHSIDKFKAIDNRYKKLDRRSILLAFQTDKMKNAQIYSDGCKLEEAKYLKEVRETMLSEKMPWVFRQIHKMVKEIGLKIAIIVQNYTLQEKLQKFMNESQMGYNVYEAACGATYDKFNLNDHLRVLVINREKLVKEWRRSKAEQECRDRDILAEEFGEQSEIFLKQITSVRHILVLDSYWHQFSEEKQLLIHKIFHLQLPNAHSQFQSIQRHHFICKDSYEGSILDRYNQNVGSFLKELPCPSFEEGNPVRDLARRMVNEARSKYEGCNTVKFLDIDDEFDRVEFAALQQKQMYQVTDEVEFQDEYEYNTHIPGLQTETPCLLDKPADIAVKLAIINPTQEIDLIDLVAEEGKIKRRKPKKRVMDRSEDILAEIKKKSNKDFLWYHSQMPINPKIVRAQRYVRIKLIPNKSSLVDE